MRYMKSKTPTKSNPNPVGPGFRTPSPFRGSIFSKGGAIGGRGQMPQMKFNPARFKTQHKG